MGGILNQKKRILVVDDDVRTTEMFACLLREDGHEVEVAHDGESAKARLNHLAMLDVLVTDLRMPLGDGFAIAYRARERQPSLPIVFVTGYPDLVSRRMKSLDPEPRVFVKPLDYAALAAELLGL
ncbi:MAG TPA: response regulator [Polyangium sp.]|nr:response regulator [Polyangium sp.]